MFDRSRLSHNLISSVLLTKPESEKQALEQMIRLIQDFSGRIAPYDDQRNSDPRFPKVDPDTAIQIIANAIMDGYTISERPLEPIALAAIYWGCLIQEEKPPKFSIEDLAKYLGVSRSSTYSKVGELRGYIPITEREIIDTMDLKVLIKRDTVLTARKAKLEE